MSLTVDFSIAKPEVLYQESPMCEVVFSNSGTVPIRVPRPTGESLLLAARVVDVKTGVEIVHRRAAPAGVIPDSPVLVALEPGRRLQGRFSLRDLMPLPQPGKYEISLLCDYNDGAGHAESRPAVLAVSPTTARNLSIVSAQGGAAAVLYGGWMNVANDPPDIVRSCFDVSAGGGVSETVAIAKGTLRTRPVLSAPPNGEAEDSHWIAWVDERILRCTHFDPRLGPSKIQGLDLGLSDAEIVQPLFSDTTDDVSVRPDGAALLLAPTTGSYFRLTSVELTSRNVSVAGRVDLPGKRPCWIQAIARSNRSRVVLYLQATEKTAELFYVPWPSRGVAAASATKRLFQLQGQFVGAGATMNDDDHILGATLIWQGVGPSARLEMVGWKVDPKGVFSLTGPEEEPDEEETAPPSVRKPRVVNWSGQVPIERCIIQVNDRADVAALLLDSAGRWQVYDGQDTKPVPGNFTLTKLPLDLAFLGGGVEPVFIGAELGGGFRIIQLNGQPLPPRREP
jgi:hypothetical protein